MLPELQAAQRVRQQADGDDRDKELGRLRKDFFGTEEGIAEAAAVSAAAAAAAADSGE